jgi:hypothetical protein
MANCFNIYDINLIDQSTITASSVNALFPVSNLLDHRRSKVFRSTSNATTLILDFQETSLIDSIFIIADKREGFGISTMTVEFNGVDNWASPPYSVAVPFSTTLNIGHVSFAQIGYRFARIVLTGSLGFCELSKIFIGKELGMSASINFGWTIKDEELSNKSKNRYGQVFTDVISRQKTLGFSFKNINKDDLQLLNAMLDRVGESKPFYIAIGTSEMAYDYRRFSGPVLLDDIPTVTNSNFNKFMLSMTVKELM